MENQILLSRRPDYVKDDIEELPESILDIKNVKSVPCLVGITMDLL